MTTPAKLSVEEILAKHPNAQRDHLIPILQEVQQNQGYLSEEAITKIGEALHLSANKIFGVATFYNQFRFSPIGKFHIMLCRGTACHVKESQTILTALEELLRIKDGQTTSDGLFSIETVACMGACGLAPVVSINGEFYAQLTPSKLSTIINKIRQENK